VLYQITLFNLPVTKLDGTRLNHEEVINALDKDTVSYDSGLGMDGTFNELLRMSIKVESSKYDTGIAWLRDVLFQSEFTKERLEITLAKVQQSLPEMKRDGSSMAKSVFSELAYDKTLTSSYAGIISLMEWIPRLAAEVQDNVQNVVEKLEKVRALSACPDH
jgi:Zn-dependent M16 (insulinase) family peptidase